MKLKSGLFSLLIPFIFLPAFAVAQEPEELASRSAAMEAVYASGYYQPVRGGILSVSYDERGIPASLTLSVSGRKFTARIWQFQAGRCGDKSYARIFVPDLNTSSDLEWLDFTGIRCRLYVKYKWQLNVITREPNGSLSRLELRGNPEP